MMDLDYPWKIDYGTQIALIGNSGSGKSFLVEKMLKTPGIWTGKIDRLIYCYGIYTNNVAAIARDHPEAELIEGIPRNLDRPLEIFNPSKNNVIVFDDLSSLTQNSPIVTDFFMKGTHHTHTACISCEHSLYSDYKERKKQASHFQQLILFRNERGLHQIATLARQTGVAPVQSFLAAYKDAISLSPYSYLVVNFSPNIPEEFRLCTNVLLERNDPMFVYL